jgi:hypothetical protein
MKLIPILLLASSALSAEICPFCQKDKAKSEVAPTGVSTRTQMPWRAYWDTAGVWHDDGPKFSLVDYVCTRGHEYKRKLGPGNMIGYAELVNFDPTPQTVQQRAPRSVRKAPGVPTAPGFPSPTIRPLECTINSIQFQAAKMVFMDCRRGNCNGKPMDLAAVVEKLFEAVECRAR